MFFQNVKKKIFIRKKNSCFFKTLRKKSLSRKKFLFFQNVEKKNFIFRKKTLFISERREEQRPLDQGALRGGAQVPAGGPALQTASQRAGAACLVPVLHMGPYILDHR